MALWGSRLAKLAQFLATGGTVPETAISTSEVDTTLRLAPDGTGGVEWGTGGAGGGVFPNFGDGSDGSTTINSGTFTLAVGGSNLLTNNLLQRDAYFDDLALNGGDLITNGFRVFVAGTLTMTSGVIRGVVNNGGNGGDGASGVQGTGGSAGAASSAGTLGVNVQGGSGGPGGANSAGTAGQASLANTIGLAAMPAGGAGGTSGAGQAGGAGGATTGPLNTLADRPFTVWGATTFRTLSAAAVTAQSISGRSAGGGGGGAAPLSGGGGGGAGGNSGPPMVICAHTITGTTNINSIGGNGGNGGNGGGANAGGGGGGNGGSGGFVGLVYHDITGWSGSVAVSAGTGGTGGTAVGTGVTGSNGVASNSGKVVEYEV